jgi:cellulose synthase/poly-beta-1,6-N-acetylglucosamine synthase-like glycosyltransferase
MKMISIILAAVSLILSLFLSSYSIRSLLFSYTARKEIQEKRLSVYNYCKSSDVSALEDNHSNKDIILNSGIKNYSTCYLHINNSFTKRTKSTRVNRIDYPFVSILIATHNERLVIDRLMKSCAALTYNRDKFEIIVVDDSEDGTFDVLMNWKQSIPNLKVIYRNDRTGWKGGALNLALKNININSLYVLVLDADSILVNDILERFVSHLSKHNPNGNCIDVIQGYPIARVFNNNNNASLNSTNINWVARGVGFRLAQRNIIEFLAKDRINLPIQITGNLFMIRSDLIKQFEFSNDLCEDWKLTLDIYFHDNIISSYGDEGNYNSRRNSNSKKVIFDPLLVSYCEAPTKLASYFRQRMRVSEGHTRAFRTNIVKMLTSKMAFINKMEFFIIGIQYAKLIPLLALIIIDFIILISNGIDFIINNNLMKITLIIQIANLLTIIGTSLLAIPLCSNIEKYNIRDSFYLLLLNLCTMPAFVIGSLRGLFRKDGIFYKTERNS